MGKRKPITFKAQSYALGLRATVHVKVYPTRAKMVRAAIDFNGTPLEDDTAGVTQIRATAMEGRTVTATVRLNVKDLEGGVVEHELHHAATALYSAALPNATLARDVLTHCNEAFAWLYSDLWNETDRKLKAHGLR